MCLRTLNVHCPWVQVLSAVGAPSSDRALPARVRCPLCHGAKLTIYEDSIYGGNWHYCFDCRRCGDMLDLATASWNVSLQVATARLQKHGVSIPENRTTPDELNRYTAAGPQTRNRLNSFWAKASNYYTQQPDRVLTRLREKFRLSSQMPAARWHAGPGKMVGACSYSDVERTFLPRSMLGDRCPSARRVFKGYGWSTVVVVPHYDVPGRICGLLCVGREAARDDLVYRGITGNSTEGGLGSYWAIENSYGMYGDKIVCVSDAFFALRLHIRHFAVSKTALPLVSYYDTPKRVTKLAWKALPHKTAVLWGWRLTPSLVHQAIVSDGYIALTELLDTSQSRIDHFVRLSEPKVIIRRVVEAAVPWREYLRKWAASVEDGVVEDMVLSLDAYGVPRNMLTSISPRFASVAKLHAKPVEVVVGLHTLIEKDGQTWGRAKNGPLSMVMNATLRIDRTSIGPSLQNKKALNYHGRLIHEGTVIPFILADQCKPDALQQALEYRLAETKPGKQLIMVKDWRARIIEAARQLSFREESEREGQNNPGLNAD